MCGGITYKNGYLSFLPPRRGRAGSEKSFFFKIAAWRQEPTESEWEEEKTMKLS